MWADLLLTRNVSNVAILRQFSAKVHDSCREPFAPVTNSYDVGYAYPKRHSATRYLNFSFDLVLDSAITCKLNSSSVSP